MQEKDMLSWYQNLYPDVEKSKTYSEYCTLAFGKDLSQQGFSDMSQIHFMLSKLNLNGTCKVLDVGCGTGKLDEYVCDMTYAKVVGLDYSQTAVQLATARAGLKLNLEFVCADMDEIEYPSEEFNVIFSVDAIFFSADLPELLSKMQRWLKKDGKLAIAYSEIRFDNNTPLDILQPQNTQIGRSFEKAGLDYSCFDLTENLYHHMRLKRKTAIELKSSFSEEGNDYLFDYIYRESIPEDMKLSEFRKTQARYLYLYKKQID